MRGYLGPTLQLGTLFHCPEERKKVAAMDSWSPYFKNVNYQKLIWLDICHRFMNLSSFQGLFGFHASESFSKQNVTITRSQTGRVHFACTKLRVWMVVKIIKEMKNGWPPHVRHTNINGLGEIWKACRRHRWVPASLTVIICIHFPVTGKLLTCVQWHSVTIQ